MKLPDPKACAEALELFDRDPMDAYTDRGDIIRDALRFCAREPDGYLRTRHSGSNDDPYRYPVLPYLPDYAPEKLPDGEELYACYRLEESDDDQV